MSTAFTALRRTAFAAQLMLKSRPFSTTPRLLSPSDPKSWISANILNKPPTKPIIPASPSPGAPPNIVSHPPPASPNPKIWTLHDILSDANISVTGNDAAPTYRPKTQSVRLAPSTGRTVHVTPSMNAATALRVLNGRMRQNGIQRLTRLQREHERPGLKRKRLKSERWRARFKQSFLATVSRVQELTRQGW